MCLLHTLIIHFMASQSLIPDHINLSKSQLFTSRPELELVALFEQSHRSSALKCHRWNRERSNMYPPSMPFRAMATYSKPKPSALCMAVTIILSSLAVLPYLSRKVKRRLFLVYRKWCGMRGGEMPREPIGETMRDPCLRQNFK